MFYIHADIHVLFDSVSAEKTRQALLMSPSSNMLPKFGHRTSYAVTARRFSFTICTRSFESQVAPVGGLWRENNFDTFLLIAVDVLAM